MCRVRAAERAPRAFCEVLLRHGPPLFNNGYVVLRTLVIGVLAYTLLIVMLRISGKRTLAKMNAFDLVVTVAVGSTLAAILLNKEVALAEGAAAFFVLFALQFAITWTSTRFHWVRRLVTGEPRLLLFRGVCLPDALRRERVAVDEVHAAVRAAIEDAEAVVLETDGSFSVVTSGGKSGASSVAELH